MNDAERAAAIAENPDYGEIFCRCEKVTKAEILQAIHNPLGVRTVNGVKVRTRATMAAARADTARPASPRPSTRSWVRISGTSTWGRRAPECSPAR